MADSENVSQITRKKSILSTHETTASVLFFVASFFFWGVRYGDYLFAIQDSSLFLPRMDFFWNWLDEPGGLLFYLTSFFIQFGRFPLLGGLILALGGVVLQIVIAKTLNLKGSVTSRLSCRFLCLRFQRPGVLITSTIRLTIR